MFSNDNDKFTISFTKLRYVLTNGVVLILREGNVISFYGAAGAALSEVQNQGWVGSLLLGTIDCVHTKPVSASVGREIRKYKYY